MKQKGYLSPDQVRSQFFAGIFNEFRTTLTLIMGQLESVMSSGIENSEKIKLLVAGWNAQRLLTLISLGPDLATGLKPSGVSATSFDQAFLEKTISVIEANFVNPGFTVESLAKEVNMSVSQLNRKLNELIDQPAGRLMRSLRLQRAAELIRKKAGSVAQIGYNLGFNDQAYFSRAFKRQFGCSPSEYMNG